MYMMSAVAALCAVALVAGLVREACRHRPDLWITSDDAVLCVVSPLLILLATCGAVAVGYRLTHGGLAAVAVGAWIGSAAIAVAAALIGIFLSARLRKRAPRPDGGLISKPLAAR